MNLWIMALITVGILVIAGVLVLNLGTVNANEETTTVSCTSCGNSCTAESNCGLKSCGAVQGRSCGCGG
jgi:hypothetical protein